MPVPKQNSTLKQTLSSGGLLAAFALLAAILLAGVWSITHEQISINQQHALLNSLHDILPASKHDNDLYESTIQIPPSELLGTHKPVTVYRAYKNKKPVAALFRVIAPDGYNGNIYLLVGIYADGRIAGVRVIAHKETPGLGDKIELSISDWILSFNGKSLGNPPLEKWAVKKHGGVFDQFTGATITPNAVTEAVKNALVYFDKNRDRLFLREQTPIRGARK